MEETSIIEIIKLFVTVVGGIIAFYFGRKEYRKSLEIKRAEFLDKLISDFLDKGTEVARNMLDDYVYVKKENRKKDPKEQKELAVSLKKYLRDHRKNDGDPVGTEDEFAVRKSFDKLFDFLTKLSYYLTHNLITVSELNYFRYYLKKIDEKKSDIQEYIEAYFYEEDIQGLIDSVNSNAFLVVGGALISSDQ